VYISIAFPSAFPSAYRGALKQINSISSVSFELLLFFGVLESSLNSRLCYRLLQASTGSDRLLQWTRLATSRLLQGPNTPWSHNL